MDTDLITDPPAPGAWNMGVDEALGERAAQTGRAAVRFYQWSPATLSLGYFQSFEHRRRHPASVPLPVVRRASGGGAIVHDRELTYSCAFPVRDRLGAAAQRLVRVFHQALIESLCDWSIAAQLCQAPARAAARDEPFLCFLRRADGDVLLDGAKIAGSAQRRHRGSVLQHGSVLLARSPAAAELPGIGELAGRRIEVSDLIGAWTHRLAARLELRFHTTSVHGTLRERAGWWQAERFEAARWTEKRY